MIFAWRKSLRFEDEHDKSKLCDRTDDRTEEKSIAFKSLIRLLVVFGSSGFLQYAEFGS